MVRAWAPGRVNLIGDHTDHTGGLVLPMAIDLGTTVTARPGGEVVELRSPTEPVPAVVALDVADPASVAPSWARYVAGVVAEVRPARGLSGTVATTLPIGAGLSSSAALEVAVALALGHEGSALETAQLCQRAENRASGVPSGIMDQLAIASGVRGNALVIDCSDFSITPVPLPRDVEIVVVFVAHRTLVGSPYAERVAECAAAEAAIGPLRHATVAEARTIDDPIVRMRAMHVTGENHRVLDFADAIRADDLDAAGRLMVEAHESMRLLYAASTPVMDAAVAQLCATPGVFGARMTGGGFGGCVVALTEPGVLSQGWVVQAVDGARVVVR
jgi:galactokinase